MKLIFPATAALLALPFLASASSLSVSCSGAPSASSIVWTGSASGGVAPATLLWSNGVTSMSQTIAAVPGTYSMTFQATDASSTVATTTCSATIAAPAPSGPSIADQIAALLNQIAALKAQVAQLLLQQANSASGTATSTPSCFSFNHDIGEGDQGEDVKDLQKTLSSDSSIFPPGLITGFFGHMTEEGVKKFQKKHGILATGFFGPKSRAFFEDQCSFGDSDHDGVPDSLDEGNGNRSATSTVSGNYQGSEQQGGNHNDNSNDN